MSVWPCAQALILQHLTRALAGLWSGVEGTLRELGAPTKSANDAVRNSRGCAAMEFPRATAALEVSPDRIGALKTTRCGGDRTGQQPLQERTHHQSGRVGTRIKHRR